MFIKNPGNMTKMTAMPIRIWYKPSNILSSGTAKPIATKLDR